MSRLFGTDGVRGEANGTLLPELAYRLGRAATLYFGDTAKEPITIIIGRDTRISGQMLESALAAGIASAGGNVVVAGIIPTPAVAYLAKKTHAKAGIVISASHNPFPDNGIKFFGGDGYKLPDEIEDELEKIVRKIEADDNFTRPIGENIGRIEYRSDLLNQYIDFVCSTNTERFDGLKIVLDCANGAAYEAMPAVLRRLGAKIKIIHALPNGVNINDNCGSTHLESLRQAVLDNHAILGIAHDGDADRCLCIDEKGEVIDGDHILIMCAQEMIREGRLHDNTVVTTVMANIGFHQGAQNIGAKTEVTKVGDRYVLENMLAHGYNLGGEQSGHIIFTDYATTGDGLITALQVLSAVKRSGKPASELNGLMTTYPQILLNVRVKTKDGWEDSSEIKAAIAKGEEKLKDSGRILVRPSGTESLIRVMAEGPEESELKEICAEISACVKKVCGEA